MAGRIQKENSDSMWHEFQLLPLEWLHSGLENKKAWLTYDFNLPSHVCADAVPSALNNALHIPLLVRSHSARLNPVIIPSTWSASCKLENHESQWHNSVFARGLKTRGADGVSPHPSPNAQEHWYLRTGEDECLSSSREQIHPSSTFLFCLGLQWIGWCLPILERVILTQSTHSNAISSRNSLTDTPRNNVLWAMWASPLAQ